MRRILVLCLSIFMLSSTYCFAESEETSLSFKNRFETESIAESNDGENLLNVGMNISESHSETDGISESLMELNTDNPQSNNEGFSSGENIGTNISGINENILNNDSISEEGVSNTYDDSNKNHIMILETENENTSSSLSIGVSDSDIDDSFKDSNYNITESYAETSVEEKGFFDRLFENPIDTIKDTIIGIVEEDIENVENFVENEVTFDNSLGFADAVFDGLFAFDMLTLGATGIASVVGNNKFGAMATSEALVTGAEAMVGVEAVASDVAKETAVSMCEKLKVVEVGAEDFVKALNKAKESFVNDFGVTRKGWRVSGKNIEECNEILENGGKLCVTEQGSTFAITNEKELVAVCKNAKSSDTGKELIQAAIEKGARHGDTYSGNLDFYQKLGLQPVSGCKGVKEYMPDDWSKSNKILKEQGEKLLEVEDVFFVNFDKNSIGVIKSIDEIKKTVPFFDDEDGYKKAMEIAKQLIK